MKKSPLILIPLLVLPALAGLEPGDKIQLTIRGLPAEEQQKISGAYRISDAGTVRLPMLDAPLNARGLEPEQFAQAAETAYQKAQLFKRPAIEVEVMEGKDQQAAAAITVAGQVRRAGEGADGVMDVPTCHREHIIENGNCSGGILNPNGIPHHSPRLSRKGLPWVDGPPRHSTSTRLCSVGFRSRRQAAYFITGSMPLLSHALHNSVGVGISFGRLSQGSPALRDNPGLEYEIPLGLDALAE
jgi:hypothetical protein